MQLHAKRSTLKHRQFGSSTNNQLPDMHKLVLAALLLACALSHSCQQCSAPMHMMQRVALVQYVTFMCSRGSFAYKKKSPNGFHFSWCTLKTEIATGHYKNASK